MGLLIDVISYLTVIFRGATLLAQGLTLGGVIFLIFLVGPLGPELAGGQDRVDKACRRLVRYSAGGFAVIQIISVVSKALVLGRSIDLPFWHAMGADFAVTGMGGAAAAIVLALVTYAKSPARLAVLAGLSALMLAASAASSHAAARLEDRQFLLFAMVAHQIGAAAWIGGIPYFLAALRLCPEPLATRAIGRRFSVISMASVGILLLGGLAMTFAYIDTPSAMYGTAYGAMLTTKLFMFAVVLLCGFMNFRVVERLRRNPATPVLRLRRFAEAEVGVGLTLFFVGASIASVPPAIDLPFDRLQMSEIVDRLEPRWPPRLVSPSTDELSQRSMEDKEDLSASITRTTSAEGYVEGSTRTVPETKADLEWSEFNHNWSGIFVLAIGVLALMERGGVRWARHWPIVFFGLAAFLFIRSDPSNWPLGKNSFFHSFLDVEVLQHRVIIFLVIAFALVEWGARTGRLKDARAKYVFPILAAAGGAFLLTHSHAVGNFKEALLIELTHLPIGALGVVAGWSRYLEVRLPEGEQKAPSWAWRVAFVVIGLILMFYREGA